VRARRTRLRDEVVTLAHGSGGKATRALVEGLFLEELDNPLLAALGDSALLELEGILSDKLDTTVKVEFGGRRGRIEIQFADLADLERIFLLLS